MLSDIVKIVIKMQLQPILNCSLGSGMKSENNMKWYVVK